MKSVPRSMHPEDNLKRRAHQSYRFHERALHLRGSKAPPEKEAISEPLKANAVTHITDGLAVMLTGSRTECTRKPAAYVLEEPRRPSPFNVLKQVF